MPSRRAGMALGLPASSSDSGNATPIPSAIGNVRPHAIASSGSGRPTRLAVWPAASGPMSSHGLPTTARLTHDTAAVAVNVSASVIAVRRLRSATEAPTKEPSARPLMKNVSVAAKAKMDGPTTIASTRVQTTSCTNVANPVSANTDAARPYRVRSHSRDSGFGIRDSREPEAPRFLTRGLVGRSTGTGSVRVVPAIESASAMLAALATMPVSTVPRRPRTGMSMKPAAREPIAAPAVLAPYNRPAGPPSRAGDATATRTAIGNVAPRATLGTRSTANAVAILTREKTESPPCSPYAHANTGTRRARIPEIDSADSATTSSSSA